MDGLNEARRRISEAATTGATELDLSDLALTDLPAALWGLTCWTTLALRRNRLEALPPDLGALTALTTLDLSGNELRTLPPELGRLTALKTLILAENRLTALPPELGRLTALTTLDLHRNHLRALPPTLGDLTGLTHLYLSGNDLRALPPELGKLTSLTHVDLRENSLTALPPEMGALMALRHLDLQANQLQALPPELQALRQLSALLLHHNPALGLPDEVLGDRAPWREGGTAQPAAILAFYFAHPGGEPGAPREVTRAREGAEPRPRCAPHARGEADVLHSLHAERGVPRDDRPRRARQGSGKEVHMGDRIENRTRVSGKGNQVFTSNLPSDGAAGSSGSRGPRTLKNDTEVEGDDHEVHAHNFQAPGPVVTSAAPVAPAEPPALAPVAQARVEAPTQAPTPPPARSPWSSGSFYLFSFAAVFSSLVLGVNYLPYPLVTVPVVVVATLLGVGGVGALQLRQDDRLAEEPFVRLMIESFKRMPLLRGGRKDPEDKGGPPATT